MNVQGAWADGITGRGIVVSILDDGLEKDHPDLIKNYVSRTLHFLSNKIRDSLSITKITFLL